MSDDATRSHTSSVLDLHPQHSPPWVNDAQPAGNQPPAKVCKQPQRSHSHRLSINFPSLLLLLLLHPKGSKAKC